MKTRAVLLAAFVLAGCSLWLEGGSPTEVEDPYFRPAHVQTVDTLAADSITVTVPNPNR